MSKHGSRKREKRNAHFNRPVPSSTDNLIRDEINTVHLIRMSRQVRLDLIRLQIPDL